MVVLNGCASVFSALATVLCEVGGKWAVPLSTGAALGLQCPQWPVLEGCIRMLSTLIDYRALNKWLNRKPSGQQIRRGQCDARVLGCLLR